MQSESTGNVITAIKFNKDKVVLCFGKMKIEISEETYTSSYFYVGKSFSDKELAKIEKENQINIAVKYAKSLLIKKMMTEWAIRTKLYEKEYEKDVVDEAVKKLKKEKLINDKAFCKEYIAYYNERCYGKNKIIQELRLKGIFDETIKELDFTEASELRKAKQLLPKLEKQYDSLNTAEKKKHIYNALVRAGFDNDIAISVLKKVKVNNKSQESNKLRRDFAVALDSGMKKYKTEDGVKAYVFRTLAQKGYSLHDIKIAWEKRDEKD